MLRHFSEDTLDAGTEEMALEAMESDDPGDWSPWADFGPWLPVVAKNREALQQRGTFERALLRAWHAPGGTNSGTYHEWDPAWIEELFLVQVDRERLIKEGDPLPEGDQFRVLRGVAGVGDSRRENGLSWSLCREVAEQFAAISHTMGLADAEVLEGVVQRKDVIAYISRRMEYEVIAKDVTVVGRYPHRVLVNLRP